MTHVLSCLPAQHIRGSVIPFSPNRAHFLRHRASGTRARQHAFVLSRFHDLVQTIVLARPIGFFALPFTISAVVLACSLAWALARQHDCMTHVLSCLPAHRLGKSAGLSQATSPSCVCACYRAVVLARMWPIPRTPVPELTDSCARDRSRMLAFRISCILAQPSPEDFLHPHLPYRVHSCLCASTHDPSEHI
jgi:hypothetical protein